MQDLNGKYSSRVVHTYSIDRSKAKLSRYRKLNRLVLEDSTEVLEYSSIPDISTSEEDLFHTVKPSEEFRLDSISLQYYGTTKLWWIIASANKLDEPMCLEINSVLRIPSLKTIYGYKGVLA